MSKKLAIMILIVATTLVLGCTGQDSGAGVTQPTPAPSGSDVTPTATAVPSADNESTPEMDLPLPPDLADL